jgi:hypothetical protein
MKSLETSLAELKKLHARYTAKVESLSAQRDQILLHLRAAEENALKTADAIAVLEGKPTLTKTITDAITEYHIPNPGHVGETAKFVPAEIPQNGNVALPTPEAGMQWIKNDLGEDVLVPINPPKPLSVPGVTEVAAGAFVMPADDSWDSPESFLR